MAVAVLHRGRQFGGAAAVHQFCRIGRLAMVGGQAHVNKDVPPFVTVDGATTTVVGLNLVGLRRAGLSREQIDEVKAAYRLIYRSGLGWEEMLDRLRADFVQGPAAEFSTFFAGGRRGFVRRVKVRIGGMPGAMLAMLPRETAVQSVNLLTLCACGVRRAVI